MALHRVALLEPGIGMGWDGMGEEAAKLNSSDDAIKHAIHQAIDQASKLAEHT